MLPPLTTTPVQHPDCCASLSSALVSKILQILPPRPAFTISIGSGTGLLEALILQAQTGVLLEAVEVRGVNLNSYLPEESIHVVSGTWELCPRASKADVWMFVYPREISLIRRYFDELGTRHLKILVWLGPRSDYLAVDQFMSSLWTVETFQECGTSPYELLAVWRRNPNEIDHHHVDLT